MRSTLQISRASLFLCAFFLFAQLINGVQAARADTSDASTAGYAIAFYWALTWWFISDSREHGIKGVDDYMDMGMFLYVAGIFLVPYYLFKSRGWKAIFTIGLFLGIYFGAFWIGAFLYSLLSIL